MLDYVVKLTKDATKVSPDDHAKKQVLSFGASDRHLRPDHHPVRERLAGECGDAGARREPGLEVFVVKGDDPRHRCADSRLCSRAGQAAARNLPGGLQAAHPTLLVELARS